MLSLLAGAANAPPPASIMGIEPFGPAVAPFAALSCIVSFLMVGHRSVYPSQMLGVVMSPSFRVSRGGEIGKLVGVTTRRPRFRRFMVLRKTIVRCGERLRKKEGLPAP